MRLVRHLGLVAVAAGLVAACSSRRPPPRPAPAAEATPRDRCDDACARIRRCSAEAGRRDLAPLLCALARCETGGKCVDDIESPSGRYHGPFRFAARTWKAACHPIFRRRGLARCRPLAARKDACCATVCAAEMIADGGLGHWPVCGKRARRAVGVRSDRGRRAFSLGPSAPRRR